MLAEYFPHWCRACCNSNKIPEEVKPVLTHHSLQPPSLMLTRLRSELSAPSRCVFLGRYADASGTVIGGTTFTGAQNAAIVEYIGADGLEEMHIFISLAWFDAGSWAWAHFITEWGTRGIFQVKEWGCLGLAGWISSFQYSRIRQARACTPASAAFLERLNQEVVKALLASCKHASD